VNNYISWPEARKAVAPIRKAALQCMRDADPEPGSGPSSRSTAMSSIEGKVIFKLYSLFERLATIEEFSFCPERIREWKEDEVDAL
jgi:hypothetical protein